MSEKGTDTPRPPETVEATVTDVESLYVGIEDGVLAADLDDIMTAICTLRGVSGVVTAKPSARLSRPAGGEDAHMVSSLDAVTNGGGWFSAEYVTRLRAELGQRIADLEADNERLATALRARLAPEGEREAEVKRMAERFLSWRLPETFNPDGGISFELVHSKGTPYEAKRQPIGTNLFTYAEALAMVRHMIGADAARSAEPQEGKDNG